MDFPSNSFNVRLIFYFVLLKDFDSNFLSRDQMGAQSHFTKCTLAKWAS